MKKKGKTLESHRLWKELASLTKNDTTRVLQGIVEKRFSICEAIQVKVVVMSSVLLSFCFALKKGGKKAVQMLPLETGCTITSYIGNIKHTIRVYVPFYEWDERPTCLFDTPKKY